MRIAFLAPASSIHTVRWVNALAERGHIIYLLTMHPSTPRLHTNVSMHVLPVRNALGYYANAFVVKRLLKQLKPQILHVHYASGYGTLGRLSGFQPMLLSVWGSDVYDFPFQSKRNMRIIRKNLMAAVRICSTSTAMAKQTSKLGIDVDKITITPFGVDFKKFYPGSYDETAKPITIGTVKHLSYKYGIDVLIRAFHLVKQDRFSSTDPYSAIRLLIVGEGPSKQELVDLVSALNLNDVVFYGKAAHDDVPDIIRTMDIFVVPSRLDSESFGVAAVEASACGVPVIAADVGGLPEVVVQGQTGYIVPKENSEALAKALKRLIDNNELRHQLGLKGREFVRQRYDWEENVSIMEKVYRNIMR